MNFRNVRNGVIVVAHPDDETLWCGGLVLRYPARFQVICCSIPQRDPIRAWKFYDACYRLGVRRSRVLPVTEPDASSGFGHLPSMLDLSDFDCIVTHNAIGEYGHKQHISVHDYVRSRWADRMVSIGYGLPPGDNAKIVLNVEENTRKRLALQCYDHTSPSDGRPKWEALLQRYGKQYDLSVEYYV